MTPAELKAKLSGLMALPTETEWVEFKTAGQGIHFDELGKYFSALSNEANIKGKQCGWLVLGVTNTPPRQIAGTRYRPADKDRESLKHEVARQTSNGMTFLDIHEVVMPEGRVLMLQIPPALPGIPTSWDWDKGDRRIYWVRCMNWHAMSILCEGDRKHAGCHWRLASASSAGACVGHD